MSKLNGKPLVQTRLPFSVLPPTSRSKDQSSGNVTADTSSKHVEKKNKQQFEPEYDLSDSVHKLTFQQKGTKTNKPQCHQRRHNDIKQEEMIRCTAITKGDQQCDSFFCWKCLSDNYCESPEMLGQTQGAYVTADGRKITLAAGMDVTWACPKCRDICTCKACTKVREERENSGSRSIMNSFVRQQKDVSMDKKAPTVARAVAPPPPQPTLSELELKYPEEVIWQRLQIREFVFRFEHLLQLSPEDRARLQDPQGDWVTNEMLKKLVCSMMELIALYGIEHSQANAIQKKTQAFLKDDLVTSSRPYLSRKHWQDLADILVDAGYEQDVPTFADEADPIISKSEVQMDWLPSFVTRSMQANGTGPMTLVNHGLDQLKVVNMLSVCTLCTPYIRNDILHGFEQVKEEERLLQNERRQYMYDDMHARTTRNTLFHGLDQASNEEKQDAVERAKIQHEIDMLDKDCDERRKRLGRKEVNFFLLNKRTCKRTSSAGTDQMGNEYWLFGDLNPDKDEDAGSCWGRGVVIVGPGIGGGHHSGEEDKACVAMLTANHKRGWWYLNGIENIDKLANWLDHGSESKELYRQLSSRSRYNQNLLNT